MNDNNIEIDDFKKKVEPAQTTRIAVLNSEGVVNTSTAKLVYAEVFKTGKDADEIIAQRGLGQISDTGQLESTILEVLNSNAQAVADFKSGKEPALKFLVGQVMKATKGRANPAVVNEILKKKLAES
jgi:aspartyl-tRNA(Asn)/glutamyl-tRNA(Gln) amidotransferase subunit B